MDQSGREHDDAAVAEQEAREWYGHLSDREKRLATATVQAYDVDDDGDLVSVPGTGRDVDLSDPG